MKNTKKQNNESKSWIIWILVAIIAAAVIAGVVYLLQGSTTTTGKNPDPESSISLTCEAENLSYPDFAYNNAVRKTTKIIVIFDNNKLGSISLTHTMYYNDAKSIEDSENQNHVALNLDFGKNGIESDGLNSSYAQLSDNMRMSLNVTGSELNNKTYKYFLINTDAADIDVATLENNYKAQGFTCKQTN